MGERTSSKWAAVKIVLMRKEAPVRSKDAITKVLVHFDDSERARSLGVTELIERIERILPVWEDGMIN